MIRKLLPLLLCSLLLLSVPGTCLAADYTITADELTRLETIFNQLEQNNNEQQQKLQKASELLMKSEQQILLLNEKLTTAEQSINQAQTSLEKVNQSFNQYSKEKQREINSLKLQRTILGIAAVYFAAR